MALQTSGQISLNDIHVEAGGSSGSQASINDADIRALISKGNGAQMSFNEWYGASSSDNLAVITTGNTTITSGSGKFSTQTTYYGFSSGGYFSGNATLGSSSNTGFNVNGISFDIGTLISAHGILKTNGIYLTGNFNGQTFQQATGFRYLKNGSSVVIDSTLYALGGVATLGSYNSSTNQTVWSYLVDTAGTPGYAHSMSVPTTAGTTMNLSLSN